MLFEPPSSEWAHEIAALARELDDKALQQAVAGVQSMTSAEHTTTLGPGGAVSPREVGYRGREDPGQIVGDVSAFYEAFVFKSTSQEPPDHVAVECGFVGYLELKRAYALACGDEGRAAVCADARQQFIAAHLQRFAEPLAVRLRDHGHPAFAPAASVLLSRVGPAPAPPSETPDDESGDLQCDTCPLT